MRWKDKGKESEKLFVQIKNWAGFSKGVVIFGAGELGSAYGETLAKNGLLRGFIDNSKGKQKKLIYGYDVCSPEVFINDVKREGLIIVICAKEQNIKEIKEQLQKFGLSEGNDYVDYHFYFERLFPVIQLYMNNNLYVSLCQVSITERCTLRCKKCAHACGYVANNVSDMTLSAIKKSVDAFFEWVDYCQEFVLIGGEPLLHKQLVDAVEYIGEMYREKINVLSITTNGTIMPSEDLMEKCRKYNVLFVISNYGGTLSHLKEKYKKLVNRLKNNHIRYRLGSESVKWMDYGFDYYDRGCDEKELIDVFDQCRTPCHEIRENRFYYCVMARSVSDNMSIFNCGEDDYLDLSELPRKNGKKMFLDYLVGFSDKGYLDMCRYCYGADAKNHPIPPAEQIIGAVET